MESTKLRIIDNLLYATTDHVLISLGKLLRFSKTSLLWGSPCEAQLLHSEIAFLFSTVDWWLYNQLEARQSTITDCWRYQRPLSPIVRGMRCLSWCLMALVGLIQAPHVQVTFLRTQGGQHCFFKWRNSQAYSKYQRPRDRSLLRRESLLHVVTSTGLSDRVSHKVT
jgi:hypothetical protein